MGATTLGSMHDDPTIPRVGAIAAWGVAASYLSSGLTAAMMPAELQAQAGITPHQFWMALSENPWAHLAFHWCWVAAGFFGVAAVPAISLVVWRRQRGVVMWAGAAAFLGFAVLCRSHLMEAAFDRKIIATYPQADAAFQQAVHVVAGLALDVPDGFLTYGAIGAWVTTVSWLARRHQLLPTALCWLGFATGLTYFAGLVGYTFFIHSLIVLAVGVGGVLLAPAWYGWLGVVLNRQAAALATRQRAIDKDR